ncbi:sulfotransferase [Thermoleophilia bacterium SCSIO 60948]|nr:sulfotransferase [Thermoleophilia bacterium SCSIO 60948]
MGAPSSPAEPEHTSGAAGGAAAGVDPADRAMTDRARERFDGARSRSGRAAPGAGALPNLIVIGGLKCGTTSVHHYLNLHPEIAMSRPKELNFFVEELNGDLGIDWYREHFDPAAAVRGETSPHYTNLPRFDGVAGRMASALGDDVRLIYMVRDPIDRILSHYVHNVGGGYESRPIEQALAAPGCSYVERSRYATQLDPYLERFGSERVRVITQDELRDRRAETMRGAFGFLGVDPDFSSEQFDREWERGTAKSGGRFQFMDRAVRLPGLRAFDRNFDRLPEGLRWRVERLVHSPEAPAAPKPELAPQTRARLVAELGGEVERLERIAGRRFGWRDFDTGAGGAA